MWQFITGTSKGLNLQKSTISTLWWHFKKRQQFKGYTFHLQDDAYWSLNHFCPQLENKNQIKTTGQNKLLQGVRSKQAWFRSYRDLVSPTLASTRILADHLALPSDHASRLSLTNHQYHSFPLSERDSLHQNNSQWVKRQAIKPWINASEKHYCKRETRHHRSTTLKADRSNELLFSDDAASEILSQDGNILHSSPSWKLRKYFWMNISAFTSLDGRYKIVHFRLLPTTNRIGPLWLWSDFQITKQQNQAGRCDALQSFANSDYARRSDK